MLKILAGLIKRSPFITGLLVFVRATPRLVHRVMNHIYCILSGLPEVSLLRIHGQIGVILETDLVPQVLVNHIEETLLGHARLEFHIRIAFSFEEPNKLGGVGSDHKNAHIKRILPHTGPNVFGAA